MKKNNQELKEKTSYNDQMVLFEIAKSLNIAPTLEEFYRSIQVNLGKVVDTSNFYIAMFNKEEHHFYFPYMVDQFEEIQSTEKLPLGKGMTSYIYTTEKPLLADYDKIVELAKIMKIDYVGPISNSYIGVPLTMDNKVIGVIAIQSYDRNTNYTEEDLDTLVIVSEQIASMIKHKEAEMKLDNTMRLQTALIDNSPVAISIRDKNGDLISANKAWRKLWNYPDNVYKNLLLNQDVNSKLIIKPEYLKKYEDEINEIFTKGGTFYIPEFHANSENTFSKYVKDEIWISLHFYALKDERNKVDKIVTFIEDISSRKISSDQRKQEEFLERLKQALGGVAHELNNPLSSIFLYSEFGKKKSGEKSKYFTFFEKIFGSAERMKKIIAKMSKLIKIETKHYVKGTAILDFDQIDINNSKKDEK